MILVTRCVFGISGRIVGGGYPVSMKMSPILVIAGMCALTFAVLSYALGAAQLGTAAATAALLVTAAGLALLDQDARAAADQQRTGKIKKAR